jgi:hypothetical protein
MNDAPFHDFHPYAKLRSLVAAFLCGAVVIDCPRLIILDLVALIILAFQ